MAPTLNQKVLVWARGRMGKQVGRGECWDLAHQALTKSGAESSTTTGEDDDYEWGEAIGVNDARPGDILQFRDYEVTTTVETTYVFDDGSEITETEEKTAVRGHHTAIVDHVIDTQQLSILEQHVKPLGKRVQRHTLPTRDIPSKTVTSHKTVKAPNGKNKPAKVTTVTTVTVSGKIWAYRPVAKGSK